MAVTSTHKHTRQRWQQTHSTRAHPAVVAESPPAHGHTRQWWRNPPSTQALPAVVAATPPQHTSTPGGHGSNLLAHAHVGSQLINGFILAAALNPHHCKCSVWLLSSYG